MLTMKVLKFFLGLAMHFSLSRRRRRNKSEGAAHSEGERADTHGSSFEINSEMDFPTLGSSCDSKVMI